MKNNMMSVWYRKGATQEITFEEFMTLLDSCYPDGIIDRDKYNYSEETIDEILNKFDSDGDGYIPMEVIDDFVKEYGIKIDSSKAINSKILDDDGITVGW